MAQQKGVLSLPEKRGDRPEANPSDPKIVGSTTTDDQIPQPAAERNKSRSQRRPRMPRLDVHGEPLDLETRRWGEALIRSVEVWSHIEARRATGPSQCSHRPHLPPGKGGFFSSVNRRG